MSGDNYDMLAVLNYAEIEVHWDSVSVLDGGALRTYIDGCKRSLKDGVPPPPCELTRDIYSDDITYILDDIEDAAAMGY